MKKLMSFALVVLFAVSLAACAAPGKKEAVRVKCPACGYEFEVPVEQ